MSPRAIIVFTVTLGAVVIANQASAPAAETVDVAPVGADATPSKVRVTALFVPAPMGVLHSNTPGDEVRVGSNPAYGVAAAFDFVPHPNAFVGFAAAYTFNIGAQGTTSNSVTAFDLTLRLGGSLPVARRFTAYGYLAPGYSFMRGAPGATEPQGPVIGAHAGAMFDLTPSLFLAAEVGYQAGFQRAAVDQMDIAYDASFFQTGIGVGARI
jgi:hypothetical protein